MNIEITVPDWETIMEGLALLRQQRSAATDSAKKLCGSSQEHCEIVHRFETDRRRVDELDRKLRKAMINSATQVPS